MPGMAIDLKQYIGLRVKQARKRAGLTQEELAEKVQKYPETISNIERGRVLIGLKLLEQLAGELKEPLSYFFEDLEETRSSNPGRIAQEERLRSYGSKLTASQLNLATSMLDAMVDHFGRTKKSS